MKITVKLHGILQEYHPQDSNGRQFDLTIDDGATVESVVSQLGIPQNAFYLATLDQKQVSIDTPLVDRGVLWLFPPVVGG